MDPLGADAAKGFQQNGHCQICTEDTGHRGAIGPPHPDAHHMLPVPADGPCIAMAIRSASFHRSVWRSGGAAGGAMVQCVRR